MNFKKIWNMLFSKQSTNEDINSSIEVESINIKLSAKSKTETNQQLMLAISKKCEKLIKSVSSTREVNNTRVWKIDKIIIKSTKDMSAFDDAETKIKLIEKIQSDIQSVKKYALSLDYIADIEFKRVEVQKKRKSVNLNDDLDEDVGGFSIEFVTSDYNKNKPPELPEIELILPITAIPVDSNKKTYEKLPKIFTVGTDEKSDIVIDGSAKYVSGKHLVISINYYTQTWIIKCLGRNGAVLNGFDIVLSQGEKTSVPLTKNQRVEILMGAKTYNINDTTEYGFLNIGYKKASQVTPVNQLNSTETPTTITTKEEPIEKAEEIKPKQIEITVHDENGKKTRSFNLPHKRLNIGKHESNDVVIKAVYVSRNHLSVSINQSEITINDNSSHGTYLPNGDLLKKQSTSLELNKPVSLMLANEIESGGAEIKFELVEQS